MGFPMLYMDFLNNNYPWCDKYTINYPWVIPGLSLGYPWVIPGLSLGYPWVISGLSLGYSLPKVENDNPSNSYYEFLYVQSKGNLWIIYEQFIIYLLHHGWQHRETQLKSRMNHHCWD